MLKTSCLAARDSLFGHPRVQAREIVADVQEQIWRVIVEVRASEGLRGIALGAYYEPHQHDAKT